MRRLDSEKTRNGFTLIEIIAALAILGLGLVGILTLFPVGIDASKRAGDLTNATVLAQGTLDQIRSAATKGNLTLNEAKAVFETSRPEPFDEDAFDNVIPFVDNELYQYEVRFEDPSEKEKLEDLARKAGLQKVTVTVSWPTTERVVELRNRVTLVTFIRFSRLR